MPSAPEFDARLEDLVARAEANSPELRKAEHALSKAAAQRALASREYLPDLTIGMRYEQVEGGTNPGFRNDGDDILTASIGVNIPIQLGRRSAAVAEAEGAIRMARADVLRVRRDLQRDVTVAYERLVELRHEAHLLHDTLLPQTKHHLKAAQKAYEVGDLDFLSLMEAEKNIEGIHRDYARVVVRYQQALSTLRRVAGGRLK